MAVRLRVKEIAKKRRILARENSTGKLMYVTRRLNVITQSFYAITTVTPGKLAKVLGVPPGELIEEVPDKPGEGYYRRA
jgi:DNA-binding Xre family transcriptional regulator